MSYLIYFFSAIVSGLICTWAARLFARQFNIVNNPNAIIPQHVKPIAYLGGVGICLGIIIMAIVAKVNAAEYIPLSFLVLCVGYMILGVVDDLKEFSPRIKFLFQCCLAATAVLLGVYFSFTGVVAIDMFLSAFWILVLVNAANLTDVCDGLVGGLSAIACLMIFFHVENVGLLPLIVAGSTIGFLVFNAPPASIFMGDAGSHLLGFILAYLSLTLPSGTHLFYDFAPLAMLSSVMLFELVFLIIVRTKKGLKWWLGSPDHFSLKLQAQGKSKWTTNIIAWSLGLLCGLPLVLVFLGRTSYFFWSSIVFVIGMLLCFGLYLLRKEAQ